MIQKKIARILFVGCFCLMQFSHASCLDCEKAQDQIIKKNAEANRVNAIKQKNIEYLERVKNASLSIRIKIASNIAIVDMQNETLQNQITLMKTNVPKLCKGCP